MILCVAVHRHENGTDSALFKTTAPVPEDNDPKLAEFLGFYFEEGEELIVSPLLEGEKILKIMEALNPNVEYSLPVYEQVTIQE